MDSRLIKEAADWFVRMHDGPPSAATRTQFTDWLLLSQEHIRAFLEVTRSIESLKNIPDDWDREKLIADSIADRPLPNVIPLEGVAPASTEGTARDRRSSLQPLWIVCIAGIALGAGALGGWLACEHWHQLFQVLTHLG